MNKRALSRLHSTSGHAVISRFHLLLVTVEKSPLRSMTSGQNALTPDFVNRLELRWTWRKLLAMRSRCLLFVVMVLPSRLIPHRHRPRAELQPPHEPQVDTLR